MKISELSRQALLAYFNPEPSVFKEFSRNLKRKWEEEGKDEGYYHWFMCRVAVPPIFEESERRRPGSISSAYWESYDYLKYLQNKLQYRGQDTSHLEPAIAKWLEVFAEQKARRQEERDLEYWGYY